MQNQIWKNQDAVRFLSERRSLVRRRLPDPNDAQAVLANSTCKIRGVEVEVERGENFSNLEISEFSEPTLNENISDTTFYQSSSSASESADENLNSVLIKN